MFLRPLNYYQDIACTGRLNNMSVWNFNVSVGFTFIVPEKYCNVGLQFL